MLNLKLKPDEPIKNIEDIKEIKKYLKKHPRPSLPKHMMWSRHKAATLIQKNVRGWLVRKRPEVVEMREFWKVIREEMKTRIGLAVPRPLVATLSDILHPNKENQFSSDTDATDYIDERRFFNCTMYIDQNRRGMQVDELSDHTQKPQGKTTHPKSKGQLSKDKSRHHDIHREAIVQTDPIIYRSEIDRERNNPFHHSRVGSGTKRARDSHHSVGKPKDKPRKSQQKPEITQQDIEGVSTISFEDLKDKNKK
nr:uncharacterized protein LOC106682741 [Halyomorpha halys]